MMTRSDIPYILAGKEGSVRDLLDEYNLLNFPSVFPTIVSQLGKKGRDESHLRRFIGA